MEFLEGETCERCSAIPWVRWYVSMRENLHFKETPEQLQSAPCPICRVIGRGIAKYDEPVSCLERWISRLDRDEGFLVWLPRVHTRADIMLYDKDDEDFIKACKVHPKRVDFTYARQWIRNCISSHVECKSPPDSDFHDLKVLDCRDRIIVSAPKHCEYVALSYVWGKVRLENALDFPRIPDILPRTVEDSIIATRMLGYRYLWIDRYVRQPMNSFEALTNGAVHRPKRCYSTTASNQPNGHDLLLVTGNHNRSRGSRGTRCRCYVWSPGCHGRLRNA